MPNYYNIIAPNFTKNLLEMMVEDDVELLYFVLDTDNLLLKIGKSIHPDKRLKQLETANPFKLILIYVITTKGIGITASELEKGFHQAFIQYHKKGEWFYFKDTLEYYLLNLIARKQLQLAQSDFTYLSFFNTIDSYIKYKEQSDLFLAKESENISIYFRKLIRSN